MKLLKRCVIAVFIFLIFYITNTASMDTSSFITRKELIIKTSPCGRYDVEILLDYCSLPFSKDELFMWIRNKEDTKNVYISDWLKYGSFYLYNKNKEWTEDDYSFSWTKDGFLFDFHGKYQDPIKYEVNWEDIDGLEMIFYD